MERLGQEALDLTGPRTVTLSSSESSSIPRMAIMSCSSLYFCKHLLHLTGSG
jgi:hypothetical protein